MVEEIVIIFDEENSSQKGNFFEDLVKEILIQQRLEVQKNVNFTGMEFDLLCQHKDRYNEQILVECKAKDKLSSNEIRKFAFNVSHKKIKYGYFLYTKNFTHQVQGIINEFKDDKDKRYDNLYFFNGEKIIELLVDSKRIKKFEFSEDKFDLIKVILCFSFEGSYYIPLFSDTTQPKYFSIYKAKTLEEVTDKNIIELVKKYIKDTKNIDFYEEKQIQNSITNSLKESNYKIIDLFSGIGGTRLGFENAFKSNANFVFSFETDRFAQKTYYENYQDTPLGDIKKINEKSIPNSDILLVDFPYQPFNTEKGRIIDKGLFLDAYIRRSIKHYKPQIIFLENKYFSSTSREIKENFEKLGYQVFSDILNAKDFSVPQNKERTYIIAFLDHNIKFEFPKPLDKKVKVGDILEENIDDKYTLSDKEWQTYQQDIKEKKIHKIPYYEIYNKESNYIFLPYSHRWSSSILIEQKDKNPRNLSPREVARLQGFPDTFEIDEDDTQAYMQLAISSTVTVISALAENILKALNK